MDWQQKPWGWTACLYASPQLELWTAHVLAGGYSSLHWHDAKINRIASRTAVLRCVENGCQIWIQPGQFHDFLAGVPHRFEVVESGLIWETYFAVPGGVCNPQDIVRSDTNGWRPPSIRTAA